jgi:pimeloyl-ACP methyl ester carboxylesterase
MPTTFTRRRLLGVAASIVATRSVGRAAPGPATRRRARHPAHFVLVHGAWHGAWCWYRIAAGLEAAGHRVTALDLPAGGIDGTAAPTVTLQAQADRVIALLDTLTTPVVLVGHSAGGPVVSTVAEARPGKVAKLVYVSAYLLTNGGSIVAAAADDPDSLVTPNLVATPAGTLTVRDDAVRDVFYGLCDDADVALARLLLKPIGALPTIGQVAVGSAFESVRRFYVSCRRDRAVTPALQRTMYTALPCEKVFTLNADHSPFFSRPAALLRALDAIARA